MDVIQPEYCLRPAVEADLESIAKVHLAAYSKSHFTSLLPAKVLISYYGMFLRGGVEIIVAAKASNPDDIIGFAVFGRNIPQLIANFKQLHRPDIMRASIAHPITTVRKVLNLLAKRRSPSAEHLPGDFLLLSIASSLPRAGVGGILLDTLSERASKNREDRVGLYVNADNIGAINAYVKDGFRFICLIYDQYYMEKALP